MKEIDKLYDLPKNFHTWRKGQEEAVEDIVTSGSPVFLLDAPTGSGKSLAAIAAYKRLTVTDKVIARLADIDQRFRCIYLTRTMQLQEQILRDFNWGKVAKGRKNYPCNLRYDDFPSFTAADCPGKEEPACNTCDYKFVKRMAAKASLAILNDAYYLTETNGPGGFAGANLVVLDEIDSLEGSLMNMIKFTVSENQCKKYGLEPPSDMESLTEWLNWARKASLKVSSHLRQLEGQLPIETTLTDWPPADVQLNKEIRQGESFLNQMRLFASEVNDSWITDLGTIKSGWQVTFKPVTVADYCDKYLWQHGDRFLGMSGTILDPEILADDLGLRPEAYSYRRLDSEFPVANRLIRYRPVANLKWKAMEQELPKLTDEVASLIQSHAGLNILVHTTSNAVRDHLLSMLPVWGIPSDKLMTHDTANRADQLEKFKNSTDMVMLSPSFDRGVDLPEDECRVIIIAKMPFMALGDKQVKARLAMPRGQRWYNLRAIQSVMQMTGRAVRSNKDFCYTYILDKQFDGLLARTRHLIPKWWLDAIVRE